MGEDLESMLDRIVSPNTCSQVHTILIRCARLTHHRAIENTLGAVKPTVGPPYKTIEGFMGVSKSKSIEEDLGWPIWRVIAIAIRDKQEFRCRTYPYPRVTDLDAACKIQSFAENLAILEASIAIVICKNDDPIDSLAFRPLLRIGVTFEHPESSFGVKCESNRLMHIWLGRNQLDREAFRHMHLLEGLVRYTGCIRRSDLVRNQRMEHGIESRTWASLRSKARRGRGVIESKIIEIQVPPTARVFIDNPHANRGTLVLAQVNGDATHLLPIIPRCFSDYFRFGARDIVQDDFRTGRVILTSPK